MQKQVSIRKNENLKSKGCKFEKKKSERMDVRENKCKHMNEHTTFSKNIFFQEYKLYKSLKNYYNNHKTTTIMNLQTTVVSYDYILYWLLKLKQFCYGHYSTCNKMSHVFSNRVPTT